jgi:hypothetical protein
MDSSGLIPLLKIYAIRSFESCQGDLLARNALFSRGMGGFICPKFIGLKPLFLGSLRGDDVPSDFFDRENQRHPKNEKLS